MSVHEPARLSHDDNPWLILGAGLFMLTLVMGLVYTVVHFTSNDDTGAVDTDNFCLGYTNGVAFGLANSGIDASTAIAMSQSDSAPPCETGKATATDELIAWCEGFARAYVTIGARSGWGDPPQGVEQFVSEFITECMRQELPLDPPVPGTQVGAGPGGAGRNHG